MTTITLWLLVSVGTVYRPSYVIERFSSQEECLKVSEAISYVFKDRCVQATVMVKP